MDMGYIKLFRKLTQKEFYKQKPFDAAHAWIDLIFLMNSQKASIKYDENKLELLPGQHLTSIVKLAERWGWSRNKVKKQFREWEDDGQVFVRFLDSKGTVLTLPNYESYNDKRAGKGQAKGQEKDTNNIIYNIYSTDVPDDIKIKRPMSDWQVDVSAVMRRLRRINKLEKGEAKLAALLIKQHGFILTVAKLEQIESSDVVFKNAKHARAYIIATLKKSSVGNSAGGGAVPFWKKAVDDFDFEKTMPDIEEFLTRN